MKPKYTLLLVFIPFLFFIASAQDKTSPNNRHEFESVKITYEIKGDSKGEAVLLTANYGWKEKWEHKFDYTIYGLSSKEHKVHIRDFHTIYEMDMISKKGKKKNDKKTKALVAYKTPTETKQALLTGDGGKIERQDTLLGQSVNVWVFENQPTVEIWEWSGLVLKEVKKIGKLNYVIVANSIELNAENSPDSFTVPKDIVFN